MAIFRDSNFKKYAVKKPKNIKQIYLIDIWARKLTIKNLKQNMYRFITIILFFFYSYTNLKAEMVSSVKIDGNNKISNETIKIYGNIQLDKNYSDIDLNRILNNLYETDFFEDVKISINDNILEIIVKEYPIINQLVIIGEKSNNYKKQIEKLINTKQKNLS